MIRLSKLFLMVCMLCSCSSKGDGEQFIGIWKTTSAKVKNAVIEIHKSDQQFFIKLKNLRGGRELDFPAAFNSASRQLLFRFPPELSDTPDAIIYLNGDTLIINNAGNSLGFVKAE